MVSFTPLSVWVWRFPRFSFQQDLLQTEHIAPLQTQAQTPDKDCFTITWSTCISRIRDTGFNCTTILNKSYKIELVHGLGLRLSLLHKTGCLTWLEEKWICRQYNCHVWPQPAVQWTLGFVRLWKIHLMEDFWAWGEKKERFCTLHSEESSNPDSLRYALNRVFINRWTEMLTDSFQWIKGTFGCSHVAKI